MTVEREIDGPNDLPPVEVVLSVREVVLPKTFEDLNAKDILLAIKKLVAIEIALSNLLFDANREDRIYLTSFRTRLNKLLVVVRTLQELIGREFQSSPKPFIDSRLNTINSTLASLQNDLVSWLDSAKEE